MFPTFRQRWIILFSIIIGAVVWAQVAGPLEASATLSGVSIFQAQVSPAVAIVLIILAGIPAIFLGLLASGCANFLSGIFIIAISLAALAGTGGGSQGFIFSSSLPGGFGWLIGETIIWLIGLIIIFLLIESLSFKIRSKLPKLLTSDHHSEQFGLFSKVFRVPSSKEILALIITCIIGGLLTNLFIQSSNAAQAIGSLIIAFAIAAFIAQSVTAQKRLALIITSPPIVAIISYVYMLIRYENSRQVLAAYYTHALPGAALVLPVFYISAGVAGTTIGLGLAQAIEHAKEQEENV